MNDTTNGNALESNNPKILHVGSKSLRPSYGLNYFTHTTLSWSNLNDALKGVSFLTRLNACEDKNIFFDLWKNLNGSDFFVIYQKEHSDTILAKIMCAAVAHFVDVDIVIFHGGISSLILPLLHTQLRPSDLPLIVWTVGSSPDLLTRNHEDPLLRSEALAFLYSDVMSFTLFDTLRVVLENRGKHPVICAMQLHHRSFSSDAIGKSVYDVLARNLDRYRLLTQDRIRKAGIETLPSCYDEEMSIIWDDNLFFNPPNSMSLIKNKSILHFGWNSFPTTALSQEKIPKMMQIEQNENETLSVIVLSSNSSEGSAAWQTIQTGVERQRILSGSILKGRVKISLSSALLEYSDSNLNLKSARSCLYCLRVDLLYSNNEIETYETDFDLTHRNTWSRHEFTVDIYRALYSANISFHINFNGKAALDLPSFRLGYSVFVLPGS
jgi:hypothetical protein